MRRAHYQAASAPLDEMPTLTDDGDEKSRYDFPMFFVFFISTPYLQYQSMYLLNISVYNFQPTYAPIYNNCCLCCLYTYIQLSYTCCLCCLCCCCCCLCCCLCSCVIHVRSTRSSILLRSLVGARRTYLRCSCTTSFRLPVPAAGATTRRQAILYKP